MLGGTVIYLLRLFLTSVCREYGQAVITQGLITGLGLGALFLPAIGVVGHYFQRRRAIAMGLTVVGSSFGGVVFPIFLYRLLASIGFGNAVRASSYLILGLLCIANILMRPRFAKARQWPGFLQVSPIKIFSEPIYALSSCRTIPNALADHFGAFNMQIVQIVCCASATILVFSMFDAKNSCRSYNFRCPLWAAVLVSCRQLLLLLQTMSQRLVFG